MINQVQGLGIPAFKKSISSKISSEPQIEQKSFQGDTKSIPLNTYRAYFIPLAFKGNTGSETMKVDLRKASAAAIGPTNGLDLDKAFETNNTDLKKAVDRLYGDRNTAGKWLKWIELATKQKAKFAEIQDYIDTNVRGKFDDVVVLGIGGSSLGAKAVINALADSQWNLMSKDERKGLPRIHFVENIDPDRYSELVDRLDMSKTLINVISKSGKTPETSATFLNLKERMEKAVGEAAKDHIVAITDENPAKSILKSVSIEKGYKTFVVPDDVGGRYSVLSDVGLFPAALAGIDIKALLEGAEDMTKKCMDTNNLKDNPAANQALVQYLMYNKGKNFSVMMPYSDKLALVSDWYAQLWAESLGKARKANGQFVNSSYTPIKTIGATDQHSQLQLYREGKNDKVYTIITLKDFNKAVPITKDPANVPDALKYMRHNSINELIREEANATMKVLNKDKRPVINIELPKLDAYNLGQLLQMFMIQTAIVGELQGLGNNTFLQPAVEEGKIIATSKLAELSAQKAQKA